MVMSWRPAPSSTAGVGTDGSPGGIFPIGVGPANVAPPSAERNIWLASVWPATDPERCVSTTTSPNGVIMTRGPSKSMFSAGAPDGVGNVLLLVHAEPP